MVGVLEVAVAVTSLVISIGTILSGIIFLGSWKRKVDAAVEIETECAKVVPPAVQDLKTKMDWVYQLQMAEVLERQRVAVQDESLTERHSPMVATNRGKKCIEKIKPLIEELQTKPNLNPSDVVTVIHNRLGMDAFTQMARDAGCSPQELLALITLELGFKL